MKGTDGLPAIGSLWIGARLSFMELLCTKSFADHGHHFVLYTYGGLENPPDWCEIRDAREVWDDDDFLVSTDRRASPAIHADVFRAKMVRKTGLIWADVDAYCLKPWALEDNWCFGWQNPTSIANGVMGLPQDSDALAILDEFLSTRGARPPWWTDRQAEAHLAAKGGFGFADLPWATTGPHALTWALSKTGEVEKAFSRPVLYPLPQTRKGIVFRRPSFSFRYIKEETISVHFFGNWMRQELAKRWFAPSSFLAHLCRLHDIDPAPPPGHPALSAPPSTKPVPVAAAFPKSFRRRQAMAMEFVFDLIEVSSNGEKPKYVQVGANDGVLDDPIRHRTSEGRFSGVLLEPSPKYFGDLEATYAGFDDVETLNVGVSSEAGVMTLYQLEASFEADFPDWAKGCASVSRDAFVKALSSVKPISDEMVAECEINVDRLDAILSRADAEDADLLVVDVEGHEPAVFESFDFKDFTPKAVVFEHVKLSSRDIAVINQRMIDAGYRVFRLRTDFVALRQDIATERFASVMVEFGGVEYNPNG